MVVWLRGIQACYKEILHDFHTCRLYALYSLYNLLALMIVVQIIELDWLQASRTHWMADTIEPAADT